MSVSWTLKNVPDDIAELLRERAKQNHRSVNGELLAILEAAVKPQYVTVRELSERAKALGVQTPNESTRWIREDRDAR
ncbi:MAG: Arc family DNA-binding protein [SAR202 cluster bacterium]|nr:Arc family DNA-binding protein [SAR202 cluster bacterium]